MNLLDWVKTKLGFGYIRAKKPRKTTHQIAYVWQVNRIGRCRKILELVYPFLILKKQQAEIILNEYSLSTPRNGKYSTGILNRKLHLVKKIQALNQGESEPPIIRQASKG